MDRRRSPAVGQRQASPGRSHTSLSPSVSRRFSPAEKTPLSPSDCASASAYLEAPIVPRLSLCNGSDVSSVSCDYANRGSTGQRRSSPTSPAYSELHFPLSSPHSHADGHSIGPLSFASAASLLPSASLLHAAKWTTEVSSGLATNSSLPKEASPPRAFPSVSSELTTETSRKPSRLYPSLEPPPLPPPAIVNLQAPAKAKRGSNAEATRDADAALSAQKEDESESRGSRSHDGAVEEKPPTEMGGKPATTRVTTACEEEACTGDRGQDDEKENVEDGNARVAGQSFSVLPAILGAPQFSSGSGKPGDETRPKEEDFASPSRFFGVPTPRRGDSRDADLRGETAASPVVGPLASSPCFSGNLRRLSTVSAASNAPGSLLRHHVKSPAKNSSVPEPVSLLREHTGASFSRVSHADQVTPRRSLGSCRADHRETISSESFEGNEVVASTHAVRHEERKGEEFCESLQSFLGESASQSRSADGSSYSACSSPLLRSPVSFPRSSSPQSSRSSSPPNRRSPLGGFSSIQSTLAGTGAEEPRNIPSSLGNAGETADEHIEDGENRREVLRQGYHYRPGSLSAAFRDLQEKQGNVRDFSPFAGRSEEGSSSVSLCTQPVSSPDSELDTPGEASEQIEAKTSQQSEARDPGDAGEETREVSLLYVQVETRMESEERNGELSTVESREDVWLLKNMRSSQQLREAHAGQEAETQTRKTKEGTAEESRADEGKPEDNKAEEANAEEGNTENTAEERHYKEGGEGCQRKERSEEREGEQSVNAHHITRDFAIDFEGRAKGESTTEQDFESTADRGEEARIQALAEEKNNVSEEHPGEKKGEDEWYDVLDSSLDETTALNTLKNRSPFTPRRRRLFLRQAGAASGVWTLHSPSESGSRDSRTSKRCFLGTTVKAHAEGNGRGDAGEAEESLRDSEQGGEMRNEGTGERERERKQSGSDGGKQRGEMGEKGRRASAPEDTRRESWFGLSPSSPSPSLPLPSRKTSTAAPSSLSPVPSRDEETVRCAGKKRKFSLSFGGDALSSSPGCGACATSSPFSKQETAEGRKTPLEEFASPVSRQTSVKKELSSFSSSPSNAVPVSSSAADLTPDGPGVSENQRGRPEEEVCPGDGSPKAEGTPKKKRVEFGSASVAVFVDSPSSYRSPVLPDHSTPLSDQGCELGTSPSSASVSSSACPPAVSASCLSSSLIGPPRPSPFEELKKAARCDRAAGAVNLPAPSGPPSALSSLSFPSPLPLLSPVSREVEKPRAEAAPEGNEESEIPFLGDTETETLVQEGENNTISKRVDKGVQTPEKTRESASDMHAEVSPTALSQRRVPVFVLPTLDEAGPETRHRSPTSLLSSLSGSVQVLSVSPDLLTVPEKPQQPDRGPSPSLFRPSPPVLLPSSPSLLLSDSSPFSAQPTSSAGPLQVAPRSAETAAVAATPLFSVVDDASSRRPPVSVDVASSASLGPASPSLCVHRETPPQTLTQSPSALLPSFPSSSFPRPSSSPLASSSPVPSPSSPLPSPSSPLPSPSSPLPSSSSPLPSSSSPLPSSSSPLPSSSSPLPSPSSPLPSFSSRVRASCSPLASSPLPVSPLPSSPLPASRGSACLPSLSGASVARAASSTSSVSSSLSSPLSPFAALDPLNGDDPLSPRLLFAAEDGSRRLGTLSSLGDYLSSVRSRLLLCGEKQTESREEEATEGQAPNRMQETEQEEEEEKDVQHPESEEEKEERNGFCFDGEGGEATHLRSRQANEETAEEAEETGREAEEKAKETEKKGEETKETETEEGQAEEAEETSGANVEREPGGEGEGESSSFFSGADIAVEDELHAKEEENRQENASDAHLNVEEVAVYEERPSLSEGEEERSGEDLQRGLSPTQCLDSRLSSEVSSPLAFPERELATRCSTATGEEEVERGISEAASGNDAEREDAGGDRECSPQAQERREATERKEADFEEGSTQRVACFSVEKNFEEETMEKRISFESSFTETASKTKEEKLLTFSQFIETEGGGTSFSQEETLEEIPFSTTTSSASWLSAVRQLASSWSRESLLQGETEKDATKTSAEWKKLCVATLARVYEAEENLLEEASRLCEASQTFVDAVAPRPPTEEEVHRLASEPWGSEISLTVEESERTLQEKVQRLRDRGEEVNSLISQLQQTERETERRVEELLHFSSSNEDLQLLAEIRRQQGIVAAFEQMSSMEILHFNSRGLLVSLSWPKSALPLLSSSRTVYLSGDTSQHWFPLSSAVFEREKAFETEGERASDTVCPSGVEIDGVAGLAANSRSFTKAADVARSATMPLPLPVCSRNPSVASPLLHASSSLAWPPPTKVCILWRPPAAGLCGVDGGVDSAACAYEDEEREETLSSLVVGRLGEEGKSAAFGSACEQGESGILRLQKMGDSLRMRRTEKKSEETRRIGTQNGAHAARESSRAGSNEKEGESRRAVSSSSSHALPPSLRRSNRENKEKENGVARAERQKKRFAELCEARLVTRFPFLAAQKEKKSIQRTTEKEERAEKRRRFFSGDMRAASQFRLSSKKNRMEQKTAVSVHERWRVEMDRFRRRALQLAQQDLTELLLVLQPSLLSSSLNGIPPAAFSGCSNTAEGRHKERRNSLSSSLAASASRRTSVCTLGSSLELPSSVAASTSPLLHAANDSREGGHRVAESSLPRRCLQELKTNEGVSSDSSEAARVARASGQPPAGFFPDMWSVRTLLLQAHTAVGRVALLHDQFLLFLLRFRTLTQVSYLCRKRSDSSRYPGSEQKEDDSGEGRARRNEREDMLAVRTALTPQDAEMPSLWLCIEIDLCEAMQQGSLILGVQDVSVEPIDEEDRRFPDFQHASRNLLQCLQDHLNSLWTAGGSLSSVGEAAAFRDEVFLQWILHSAIECGYDRTLWLAASSTSISSLFQKKRVLEELRGEKRSLLKAK
uniref:Uncharacterized protein n=1 Tax=Toxoplasma gondii COUG TaxID=1074873 RepID=A0A2G8XQL9_TOXGO|nr:hypothetical protein TGCOUG_277940 [Toxoplasma gondii COUG]